MLKAEMGSNPLHSLTHRSIARSICVCGVQKLPSVKASSFCSGLVIGSVDTGSMHAMKFGARRTFLNMPAKCSKHADECTLRLVEESSSETKKSTQCSHIYHLLSRHACKTESEPIIVEPTESAKNCSVCLFPWRLRRGLQHRCPRPLYLHRFQACSFS